MPDEYGRRSSNRYSLFLLSLLLAACVPGNTSNASVTTPPPTTSAGTCLAVACAACLVTQFDTWQTPIVAFVMTDPAVKRHSLATNLIKHGMNSLLDHGYTQLCLAVTDHNAPAQHAYNMLGFEMEQRWTSGAPEQSLLIMGGQTIVPTRADGCQALAGFRVGPQADFKRGFNRQPLQHTEIVADPSRKGDSHMVVEIAEFIAQPGKAQELQAGLIRGLEVIRRGQGCQSARLRACVEDPNRFIYEIQWETLEAHTVTFRGGPLFPEYRSHITGLFVEPVTVHHYEDVNG